MSALPQYEEALRNYPHRGSGLHQHIMRLARLGSFANLTDQQMMDDINAIPKIKTNEAKDAIEKARLTTLSDTYRPPTDLSRFAIKTDDALADFIQGYPTDEVELFEKSPRKLDHEPKEDGLVLLDALYRDDDTLFVGDVYDRDVYKVRALKKANLHKKPFIIPNPMTGEIGMTDANKPSFRCEATVKAMRFAVCEMDEVSIPEQVAFWLHCIEIDIPVACIIHSGGKSLHGWVYVGCETKEKWDEDVRGWLFEKFGKAYGFDSSCKNMARLSRMPSHIRDNGNQQRLLYLNPEVVK